VVFTRKKWYNCPYCTVDGVNTEFGIWVGGPQKISSAIVNYRIRLLENNNCLEMHYSTNHSLDKERVKNSANFSKFEKIKT
jgi:hypothetical protein